MKTVCAFLWDSDNRGCHLGHVSSQVISEIKGPWISGTFVSYFDFYRSQASLKLALDSNHVGCITPKTPSNPLDLLFERLSSPLQNAAGEIIDFHESQKLLRDLLPPKLPKPPDPSHTREQSDFCSSITAVQRLSPLRLMSRRRAILA